jgi:hypothetical protein
MIAVTTTHFSGKFNELVGSNNFESNKSDNIKQMLTSTLITSIIYKICFDNLLFKSTF